MKGFTLIEVLVSIAIFSIIGITTIKQITLIRNTKDTAFKDIDLYDGVRTAISIMRDDIGQAFHVLMDDLGKDAKAAILQNQAVPHTLLDGRKNEIIFTTLSHRIYYAGKKECHQAEISYFLQKKDGNELPSLMKRESGLIDSDLYQGGVIYTLLDNVVSLEFKYWDPKLSKWQDEWNTDGGAYLDRFPPSIKMKLTVATRNHDLPVETVFKIDFPNNEAYVLEF